MGALEASFGTAPVLAAAFDSGAAAAGLSAAVEGPFAGRDGATFTPAVGEDGTLSWTNDKGLENPSPVNIMGPAGADGAPGPQGPQGEPGPAAVVGEDLYVGERARLRSIDAARGNLQLFNAAGKTSVNAYATENGIGELDVHDADGAAKASLYANTAGEGVLRLKNAAGEAETLYSADVTKLKGIGAAKLWENASPDSAFAAQTLSVDWTPYDFILILYSQLTSWPDRDASTIASTASEGAVLSGVWGSEGTAMHRLCEFVTGGIAFNAAYYNTKVNNDACVPRFIYGIKAVF